MIVIVVERRRKEAVEKGRVEHGEIWPAVALHDVLGKNRQFDPALALQTVCRICLTQYTGCALVGNEMPAWTATRRKQLDVSLGVLACSC